MNVTRMAERALKALHRSLPTLRMGNGVLFLPPIKHVLRGFALEPNLEMKGTAYLWRVVLPLYRPPTYLILNYSERLLDGEKVSVLEPDLDQTIDRLVRAISRGELDYLNGMQTPQDFLQKIDWNARPSSPNYRIDLALTHYMTEDVPACRKVLEQVVCAKLSPRWADNVRLAQEMLDELKADPSVLARRVEAWEATNTSWFHLESRKGRRTR
jgi:hypothetical protein